MYWHFVRLAHQFDSLFGENAQLEAKVIWCGRLYGGQQNSYCDNSKTRRSSWRDKVAIAIDISTIVIFGNWSAEMRLHDPHYQTQTRQTKARHRVFQSRYSTYVEDNALLCPLWDLGRLSSYMRKLQPVIHRQNIGTRRGRKHRYQIPGVDLSSWSSRATETHKRWRKQVPVTIHSLYKRGTWSPKHFAGISLAPDNHGCI